MEKGIVPNENIRKGTVNEFEYMMAKERLIVKKFPRYYGQNYNLMFMEVDARLKAAREINIGRCSTYYGRTS